MASYDRAGRARRTDAKQEQFENYRVRDEEQWLTTDQGVRVADTDNSLSVGERGPTLMEDYQFREKVTHFDHERIPERVVHARGAGAYGYFQVYEPLTEVTCADFLTDPRAHTPVFVRFSTVVGSRGSADTVRDVRGFATKFYTREGNFDLVGNNVPVFFIQDGVKFPDFVHAVKPEPHNEIPQAASAHDTMWDFVRLQPETMHMMMWLMSDRALPRSYRMMQGFGVHTFRFVNAEGRATFVKFHWNPRLGTHSLIWDEAQKIAGADPDFNRRDLWDAIDAGQFPQWELGAQLVPENREHDFPFDLLDPTKLIPEEQVPVRPIGRLVLDRNPNNFFAETEQVAFHLGNVVPGIDFTNDPLLQARLFSYLDTQLIRLGGPNFAQLPVNQPVTAVHNHHRDGYHQTRVHVSESSYEKNTIGAGCPMVAGRERGGYESRQEHVDGAKIRRRSASFNDHYGQAALFWRSMSGPEREHIVAAFEFELGKVSREAIREGVVAHLAHVDRELAARVGERLGIAPPHVEPVAGTAVSPALSQANLRGEGGITSRRIAILGTDGVAATSLRQLRNGLAERGAVCELLAPRAGVIGTADNGQLTVDRALVTMSSVLYDAVFVPDSDPTLGTLPRDPRVLRFVNEAYEHGKAIAALGTGTQVLRAAQIPLPPTCTEGVGVTVAHGVVTQPEASDVLCELLAAFSAAIAAHRHNGRALLAVPT